MPFLHFDPTSSLALSLFLKLGAFTLPLFFFTAQPTCAISVYLGSPFAFAVSESKLKVTFLLVLFVMEL